MGSLPDGHAALPYWQVNVPPEQREPECPPYLADLSAKDVRILSTPDAQYRPQTWPEVVALVRANRLAEFRRVPSQLRRYREHVWRAARAHGSVMAFVLRERLGWWDPAAAAAPPPAGRPFECPGDLAVLRNDWPYGVDPRIVHLVVWTKFALEEDPATGDLTDRARAEIQAFVDRTFGARVPRDHYVWFKNWRALKSIHAVEHFHVMLFDPDPEFVREVTHGDVPRCQADASNGHLG